MGKSRSAFYVLGEPRNLNSDQIELALNDISEILKELDVKLEDLQRLHDRGFLSFDPGSETALGSAQVMEMRFIVSLMKAGCDAPVLATLLNKLQAPYAYEPRTMLFDFVKNRWLRRTPADRNAAIDFALKSALLDEDVECLVRMGKGSMEALEMLATKTEDDKEQ